MSITTHSRARFHPTRWSLILAANADSPDARRALDDLLRIYWFPLYACLRRRGHAPDQAEDLTQGFLADLLTRNDLAAIRPAKGKFRSFLLAALTHYVSNQRDHARAVKRGGAHAHLSLHAPPDAESRYALEPSHILTPERLFDRRWALALLDQVLATLRARYAAAGQSALFDALSPLLTGELTQPYAQLAPTLGLTEPALKVAAHRLRKRYRDTLRAHIAATLPDPAPPAAIDEEIAHLLNSL
ncbi:MAG TPA: sigma-70 family RNA polymerase sigma factor [Phycisphaerae bacterium]|nr:sigma-70 family RNA polymerase sigma factor [Phycisphaerae bacterium]